MNDAAGPEATEAGTAASWLGSLLLILLLGLALAHLPAAPGEFTLNGLVTMGLGIGALRLLMRPLEWRCDPPFVGLGILGAWTILRALTGPSLYLGALELGRELPLMVLAWTLASRQAGDREPAAMLRALLVASLTVVAAACVPELSGGGEMPASWADPTLYQALTFRLTSIFDNPNLLGVFLAGIVPLAFHRVLTCEGPVAGGWGVVFVLASTMMLFSFSRGGWVGAAAGLGLATIQLFRSSRAGGRVPGRRAAWLVLGLVPVLVAGRAALGERLGKSGKAGELGIHQRLILIDSTLALCGAHLALGAGTNAYELFMTKYRSFGGYYPREAHGMPLQVTAELGLVGLGAYLLLMVGLLGQGLRAAPGEADAGSALAGFLVASCFISSSRYLPLKILGWMLVGWAAAPPAGSRPRRPLPRPVRGIVATVVAATSLYVWGFIALGGMGEGGLAAASLALPFADDLVFLRAVRAYRAGKVPEGRELLGRARTLSPYQSRYTLELARDALMRGEHEEARRWIVSCREMDPWSEEAMLLEAQLELKEKRPAAALLLLETALQTNPQYLRINRSTYPSIVFMLIAVHRHDGDPARAAALEREFADILPKSK